MVFDDPYAAARRSERALEHQRENVVRRASPSVSIELRARLRRRARRAGVLKPALLCALVIGRESRQRERHVRRQQMTHLGESKALLVDGQQHVEARSPRNEIEREREVALRVDAESRAAMKSAHEAGEAADAMGVRIADLE